MTKQCLPVFILLLLTTPFLSSTVFAEDEEQAQDEQKQLETLRGIVHRNTKPELLTLVGKKRLTAQEVAATAAVYEAAEKILANKNISEEFQIWTIKRKTLALMILAYEETPRYFPLLAEDIDELGEKDCFAQLLQEAEYHFLVIGSVQAVKPLDPNDKKSKIGIKPLTERIILFAKEHPGEDAETLIRQLLGLIKSIPLQSQRDKMLAIAAPLLIQYFTDTKRSTEANLLAADARRALLPGQQMLIGGYDLEGKMYDTAKLKDKVVLLQFWGTWCPHCKEEIPDLINLYEKYHSKGFEIIGINTAVKGDENMNKVKQFIATTGFGVNRKMIPWTILHEGFTAAQTQNKTMTRYYGIEELPVLILVGRNGLVRKLHPLPSTLDAEISAALNAVELTPEEQALAEAARKKKESEIDQQIHEELKTIK